MTMHPWVATRLAEDRRQALVRAGGWQPAGPPTGSAPAPGRRAARGRLARRAGVVLIAAGRRLAGPDAVVAALDGHR